MGTVIMLSGPIGAGKTTIAKELISILPGPLAQLEGDTFWSFLAKPAHRSRREDFPVILRAMTAAAIPFARSGYDVLIDFSAPPEFLGTARKILKELPLDYIVLRPSRAVCEDRAARRVAGAIADYTLYGSFYSLFEDEAAARFTICNDDAEPAVTAALILEGLRAGTFRVS